MVRDSVAGREAIIARREWCSSDVGAASSQRRGDNRSADHYTDRYQTHIITSKRAARSPGPRDGLLPPPPPPTPPLPPPPAPPSARTRAGEPLFRCRLNHEKRKQTNYFLKSIYLLKNIYKRESLRLFQQIIIINLCSLKRKDKE